MMDLYATDDLAGRLTALGDALAVDDAHLVEAVLARVDAAPAKPIRRRWLAIAAAVVVLVVAGVALTPGTREAVARWLGLERVSVEVDPELPSAPPPASFELPGPGESVVVEVDGRQILVSTVTGRLSEPLIAKTVGSSDQVQQVEVDGYAGLWISGAPHEVRYESPARDIVVERVAADTLLWERDGVLLRVEGFDRLSDALAFAEGT